MWNDEIIKEIRRIREEYVSQFNYDLKAIFRDLKEKEKNSGRKYYDFSRTNRNPRKRKLKMKTQ